MAAKISPSPGTDADFIPMPKECVHAARIPPRSPNTSYNVLFPLPINLTHPHSNYFVGEKKYRQVLRQLTERQLGIFGVRRWVSLLCLEVPEVLE